jgi:hypothetical protein
MIPLRIRETLRKFMDVGGGVELEDLDDNEAVRRAFSAYRFRGEVALKRVGFRIRRRTAAER